MNFYHPSLLIGLAGMLVPIILHLLNRRHAKLLDWGATQFLLGSLVSRRRRLLLEEMMLLAMRCLLCALAVLVIARPLLRNSQNFWTSALWVSVIPLLLLGAVALAVGTAFWQERIWRWRLWAAGALMILGALLMVVVQHKRDLSDQIGSERDLAIIIDSSTTMGLTVDGKTNYERAVEEARQLVSQLGPETTVHVFLAGSYPKQLTKRAMAKREDVDLVLEKLKTPLGGPSALMPAIKEAWSQLRTGQHADKQIVVFTDQQRNSWGVDDLVGWRETVREHKDAIAPPRLYARTYPLPQKVRNVTVTKVEPARRVVGTDRTMGINVEIKNTGTEPISADFVKLTVDGNFVKKEPFDTIGPGQSHTVSFSHRFSKAGAGLIEVSADINDDLVQDNTRSAVVRVLNRIPVLIVSNEKKAKRDFLEETSAIAQSALAPGADESPGDGNPYPSLVQTRVVDLVGLESQTDLSLYRVIILADVSFDKDEATKRVAPAVAQRLAQYVEQGGSLLVAPGGHATADFYNRWQRAGGEGPLLPARLEKRIELVEKQEVALSPTALSHPSLAPFAEGTSEPAASFRTYWKLASSDGNPVLSGGDFSNGDPLLVEKKTGAGAVTLLAAALDLNNSNFAKSKPAFPIFMHLLVYHLADMGRNEQTFEAGKNAVLALIPETGQPVARREWKPGLRGEYFAGGDFQQTPVTQEHPTIQFDWKGAPPVAGIAPEKFAVRFSGAVTPAQSGEVTLLLSGQGNAQLYWDGNDVPLITRTGPGTVQKSVKVEAQKRYRLRIEETKTPDQAPAAVKLQWQYASGQPEVIPQSVLSYDAPAAPGKDKDKYRFAGPGKPTSDDEWNTREPLEGKVQNSVLLVNLPAVSAPGVYYLKPPQGLAEEIVSSQDKDGLIPVVMTGNPQETDLAATQPADWTTLAEVSALEHAEGENAIKQIAKGNPVGRELWKYLAVTALLILIGEVALTRWIAVQRQVTADPVSDFEFRATTGEAAHLQRFASSSGRQAAASRAREAVV